MIPSFFFLKMLLIIVLLLFLFMLIKSGSGGRLYYVVKNNKHIKSLIDTKFASEIYRLNLLREGASSKIDINKMDNKNYEVSVQSFENNLTNYYFENNGLPNLSSRNESLKHLEEKIGAENLIALQNFYKSLCEKYDDDSIAIVADLSREHVLLDKFEMHHFRNRGTNISDLQNRLKVVYFYKMIESLQPGNQWTLSNDNKIVDLKKRGFLIECFGSSLNARLKYFGSMSEIDNPFGRIDDGFILMDKIADGKELEWHKELINNGTDMLKLLINPPSSNSLVYGSLEKVLKILEKRPRIEIIYEIPLSKRNHEFDILVKKYGAKETLLKKAWTYDGIENSLNGREWVEFHIIKK